MTPLILQKTLEERSGLKRLQIKLNENFSTMLSLRKEPCGTARLSLHRMFLEAPQPVTEALANYLKSKTRVVPKTVRFFIEEKLQTLDYSHTIKKKNLLTQGSVYNLEEIFERLNHEYFNNSLDLSITWFGRSQSRNRSKVVLGLYYSPLKLIKIHRLLDTPWIPDYLIDYVVYHEMVHHVCPSYYNAKGKHQIHSPEFKSREQEFRHFELAQNWIRNNQPKLFQTLR